MSESGLRPSPGSDTPLTVIIAYGDAELTQACVEHFGAPEQLVVVDNGLDDELRATLIGQGVRYERPARNVGFAAAVNLALSRHRCPGQDVLLLNPDALVTSMQAAQLVAALDGANRATVAAVAPQLRSTDGSPQRTTWPVPTPGRVWLGVIGLADWRVEAHFLSGAVLLLNGDALDALGGFDERYFLYSEETDWQRRALRAGWSLRVLDTVEVEHVGGATSSDLRTRELLFHASAEAYFRKWHGRRGWQVARAGACAAAVRRRARGDRLQGQVARLYITGPQREATRRGLGSAAG